MRAKGRIASWDDDKGFGFILPLAGGDRIFVHIKAFANRSRRPKIGDVVTYAIASDSRGRLRAEAATVAGVRQPPAPKRSAGRFPQLLAVAFLLMVCAATLLSAVPPQMFFGFLVLSVVTFAAYWLDKQAARRRTWRTRESTLHLLALLGGWPGALIARGLFRHKTTKQPFRSVLWTTVVLNCALSGWLVTPEGEAAWRSALSALCAP
jgi:uncharacterized membrane protein YsdA (DUF1294 family)/cold shock CspA family protein